MDEWTQSHFLHWCVKECSRISVTMSLCRFALSHWYYSLATLTQRADSWIVLWLVLYSTIDLQVHVQCTPNRTLRAVGFSAAKQERNHCEQPCAFSSSMRKLGTPHVMYPSRSQSLRSPCAAFGDENGDAFDVDFICELQSKQVKRSSHEWIYNFFIANLISLIISIIVSVTKFSIVIGSPRAYLSRNRRAITWVQLQCPIWTFSNRTPVIGYPRDFHVNYPSRSSDFEITCSITPWIVLHSVQLLLLISSSDE